MAKRDLSDEDSSEPESICRPKPRRKVAFTAPKSAATRAIVKRNATSSPLLRLPIEIRNKIWTEVLGGRLIHVAYFLAHTKDFEANERRFLLSGHGRSAWRHTVCRNDCPESSPDKEQVSLNCHDEEEVYTERPHDKCLNEFSYTTLRPYCDDTDGEGSDTESGGSESSCDSANPLRRFDDEFGDRLTMALTVLRVCRQTYSEANQVLWSTNTFSFHNSTALKRFMMTRSIYQKRLIRCLRLDMDWNDMGAAEWNSALGIGLIRSLSGLRTLRLRITYNMHGEIYQKVKDDLVQTAKFCEGLRKISTLPLTSVEIAVTYDPWWMPDDEDDDDDDDVNYWKQSDMDQFAKNLKEMLLNPHGAEIYAQQQQKLEGMSRDERMGIALEKQLRGY
ncbi:MAG: hypothetical protein Q9170_004484 [Blastenia crenularia]